MKVKKIITIVFIVLAVGMSLLSGIMKLIGSKDVLATLALVKMEKYTVMLGLMEITFALLFLFRPTMKIGFILLSCYFAGALSAEIANGLPYNALLPIVLVWIAAFLRDNGIFLSPREMRAEKEGK
ncbi:MAG TPA: hypothetical protein VK616_03730 [Flavitalea sp.]|nr:hypothetical protein [Flavitalea sp.]